MSDESASNPYQTPFSNPDLPVGAGSTGASPLKDPRWLGWLAIAFISLVSLVSLVAIGLRSIIVERVGVLNYVYAMALLFVCATILFLMWLYRCAKNAVVMNRRADIKPAWVIWAYFIPIANWFMPFLSLREISRETFKHRRAPGMDSLILVWWISFVIRAVSGKFATAVPVVTVWAVVTMISWFAITAIIFLISRAQMEFRFEEVPMQDRPVMVPLRTGGVPLPVPGAGGRTVIPPRRVLLPVRPIVAASEAESSITPQLRKRTGVEPDDPPIS